MGERNLIANPTFPRAQAGACRKTDVRRRSRPAPHARADFFPLFEIRGANRTAFRSMTMPKKVTVEGERNEQKKAACDVIVERAAEMMFSEVAAPIEMIIDRLVTYAVAQMVLIDGKHGAASVCKTVALQVEAGAFDSVLRGKQH
jgi:hypothetical protein